MRKRPQCRIGPSHLVTTASDGPWRRGRAFKTGASSALSSEAAGQIWLDDIRRHQQAQSGFSKERNETTKYAQAQPDAG
jgi:hypothetical protein